MFLHCITLYCIILYRINLMLFGFCVIWLVVNEEQTLFHRTEVVSQRPRTEGRNLALYQRLAPVFPLLYLPMYLYVSVSMSSFHSYLTSAPSHLHVHLLILILQDRFNFKDYCHIIIGLGGHRSNFHSHFTRLASFA